MAVAKKGPVLRVTGLSASRPDEELAASLKATIKNELTDEEKAKLNIKVDIVPSCYVDEEKVALLECCGGLPAFLSALAVNPLREWQIEMGDTGIDFDQHFFGFTQLYTPASDTPVVADVIAITGLDGHAYGSWRGKGSLGRMWLRDFLCKDLPNCRTMIYGYNSKLSSRGVEKIMDYERGLLEELRKVRSTKECLVKVVQTMDPMIASLHKATYGMLLFGIPHRGLVVDDIQKMVSEKGGHPRRELLEQIKQKSDQLASQLDSFRNIIQDRKVVSFYETEQTRQLQFDSESNRWARTGDFVTAVDSDSALLQLPDSIEEKIPLAADHSMMVKFDSKNAQGYSSARARLMQFAQDAPSVVADRFVSIDFLLICLGANANIYTHEEHNSQRPPSPITKRRKIEGIEDLETDTANQQKFTLASKKREEPASGTSAQLSSQQRDCLRSLSFTEQEHRFDDIHAAVDTCDWLLEHEGYQTWMKGHSGLFWIKGNPGAGKSVLMKHSVKRIQHLTQLAARFTEKEKRYGGFGGHAWEWTENELKEALSYVLSEGTQQQRVVIFIDALDECGEDPAKRLLAYFKGLTHQGKSKHAQFKVCLSSRHYPILALDTIPSVQVEKMNNGDIRWYVKERLKDIRPETKREQIQDEILSKSNGGFQWVVLVTETIIDKNLIGINAEKLLEGLANCPKTLSKMYESILNGVPAAYQHQMIKIFQWVLFAERPLSAQELRDALAADKDMSYKTFHALRAYEGWSDTLVDFERYVKHISRGLICFQSREIWEQYELDGPDSDREAQLIHQSVADFLMEEFTTLFGNHLPAAQSLERSSQVQISRSCLRYMILEDILEDATLPRGTISSKYPLAPYAVRFLFAHIKKAEQDGIPQSDLLSVMQWTPNSESMRKLATLWRNLDPNSAHMPLGWPFIGATALHVLVAFGFLSAVNSLLKSGCGEIKSRDIDGNTPLMLAIREGHHDIALVLLDRIADCEGHREQRDLDEECGVTLLSVACATIINAQNKADETALDFALEQNMREVVVKLIEAGANLKYLGRKTALVAHAVSTRNTKLLSILIERKLKLDGAVFFALKDLVAAHDPVLESIVFQLLSAGANTARSLELNAVPDLDDYDDVEEDQVEGGFDTDALAVASRRGLTNVVEMLLEHGAPAALRNDQGKCPMLIATEYGHVDVVRMLLSKAPSSVGIEDDDGHTALSIAIQNHELGIIELLLREGRFSTPNPFLERYFIQSVCNGEAIATGIILQCELVDPDMQDDYGTRPLFWAARNGHEAVVKQLLDTGKVDPDAKDKDGWTPLLLAAQRGYEVIVKQLLDTGKVDPDTKDHHGLTPMLWGARNGYEAVIKQLLHTDKVDPDAKDKDGCTPLLYAAEGGHEAMVKQLLDTSMVDPDAKDKDGWTPLLWAVRNGHETMVKHLLDTSKVDPDTKDKDGWTPLLWAVRNRHEAMVKQLLDTSMVDPNAKDKDGWTPLLWAVRNGHETMVKQLLDTSKVDPDTKDKDGWTPLLWAVRNRHEAMVKQLLDTSMVDPNAKDKDGWTPLLWAVCNGHETIVEQLLNTSKVDPNAKDKYGWTPLLLAARIRREAIVKQLLDTSKVDPNAKDKDGWTPLLWAVRNRHETIVKQLLDTGMVDPDAKDKDGWTPLLLAAQNGQEVIVKQLLDTGKVDPDAKDKDGWTPLLLAAQNEHTAVFELLLQTFAHQGVVHAG
ncbi:hypothetical protein yc1106_02217 [Curvularia clavata]|uniref:Nephrocystin 3-like N-terminal domain-containing protein n=1 Tax=Curvularia clavata TaxID=95742 RepID=A0A9Q8Z6S2_CURCL|nr:hypothetical protein yc1106_02217 [Curvularia clavata]